MTTSEARTAQSICSELGIRLDSYASGEHRAICPWCTPGRSKANQKDKDLSVTIDHKHVVWNCHHCSRSGARFFNSKGDGSWWDATYDYHGADGNVRFQVRKKKIIKDGEPRKIFAQYRPNGKGGWIKGLTDKKTGEKVDSKILYRLPELNEAIANEQSILLLEGEKDVEAAWKIGLPATTSPGGASEPNKKPKWCDEYTKQLRDGDIIIIPDHDPPGYAHAYHAAKALVGVAKRVRVLKLAEHWNGECPKGGDLSDWLKAGGTREQLDELIASALDYGAKADLAPAGAMSQSDNALQWRGWRKDGTPADTMHNARVALVMVGLECSYDSFHNKLLVGRRGDKARHELQAVVGELSDHIVIRLRRILGDVFDTDFCDKSVRDAVTELALEYSFDPVRDMLDQAQAAWDGVERLDRMAVDYLNCEDTPLNRAIMRKTMIAAVRRARKPGCKFDNICVLESEEGWLKSTAWRVLAGDENFSDESILGKSGREIQEQLSEVWIHESADLAGMRKAEVESVKAFASRQVDIARPAYGYFVRKQPRHAINVGTTNSDEYLQSQTGNRRFWPLKVLRPIDIAKLEHDRLLLWGEAAKCESDDESLTLAQELWPAAVEEQEKRRIKDPWEEVLADIPKSVSEESLRYGFKTIQIVHRVDDHEFVASADLLTHVLGVPTDRQDRHHGMRLADTMKRLKWKRDRVTIDGVQRRGFARLANLANLFG
jgi:Virulence-associated protein E